MEAFKKTVRIGKGASGSVFCSIEFTEDGRLSISGVEGPKSNGDARGSCGQIVMSQWDIMEYAPGWDADLELKFRAVWDLWHLNDMRPGCEHQRGWDTQQKIEIVSYGLTSEAYHQRVRLLEMVAKYAARNEATPDLSAEDRALLVLDKWYQNRHTPPDADDPLSGCYEVKKRETKAVGWVNQEEHPAGILSKPCEICGYKYGTRWIKEEVPVEVLNFLKGLPDSDLTPAWV